MDDKKKGKMSGSSPIDVQKYLEGMDFPATKQDIIDKANENDAPDEVMVKIDSLDEKEYESVADISKTLKNK